MHMHLCAGVFCNMRFLFFGFLREQSGKQRECQCPGAGGGSGQEVPDCLQPDCICIGFLSDQGDRQIFESLQDTEDNCQSENGFQNLRRQGRLCLIVNDMRIKEKEQPKRRRAADQQPTVFQTRIQIIGIHICREGEQIRIEQECDAEQEHTEEQEMQTAGMLARLAEKGAQGKYQSQCAGGADGYIKRRMNP